MIDFFNNSLPMAGLLNSNPHVAKMQLIVGIAIFATFAKHFLKAIGAGAWAEFIYIVGLLASVGITFDMAWDIYKKLT